IRSRRPSPALVLSTVALLAALGGVGWAAIPGPEGIIHGCYNKRSGALRVIDIATHAKCARKEAELNWEEIGPPGPRGGGGPRGQTGATGPQGTAGTPGGLSNAYTASQAGPLKLEIGTDADAVNLTPPAGDYVVSATVTLENKDTKAVGSVEAATCQLDRKPSGATEATAGATVAFLEGGSSQTVALDATLSLAVTESLELSCTKTSSGTVSAVGARIDATEVGSISESP
ncbi:MAG TPA: hypothetical protein VED41_05455, partial [Solirubrobacteraceae bacterium]|nr:hypothetical protein [Solirubrobacteraceae bacterium]